MDILLHIGMPKSGSTAIQHRFTDRRGWLARQGLHYPEGLHTTHNHSFLVAAAADNRPLPRHYRRLYGKKTGRAQKNVSAWFDTVLAEADAARARLLVLSAETLFRTSNPENVDRIVALLRRAGGRIVTVAYLRRPSEFYVSAAQQRLKASHDILPPEPVEYRASLEAWEAATDELRVRAYDRGLFPGGDIGRAFYGETGGNPDDLPPPAPKRAKGSNVSVSAEGMALLAQYRGAFHADAHGVHRKDSNALLGAIVAAEADPAWPEDDPAAPRPGAPRLHPDLADYLDHGTTDLLWLRERFGIVFRPVDYDRIRARPPWPRPGRVEDICPVDPGTYRRLALGTMRSLATDLQALRRAAAREEAGA